MTPQVGAPRAELSEAVDAVQAWIDRRQRAMLAHLHSCSQSPAQLHVLGVLRDGAPITVSHLASRLGISPPSASAIVDRMVDGGLVARERSEEDRRIVSVSLTPAGEAALKEAIGGRRGWLERVLGRLDAAELVDTVRVLRRLEQALDEERPGTVAG
ncbi:MAG: MarR family transcriptional regulator [Candidatus Dormibacteraeota bacterium]|nr:MarR family transcriptional regulator [Candidatus Dormibacteraeota bacterium]